MTVFTATDSPAGMTDRSVSRFDFKVAAKAVYQFISPLTDKQSRDEALTWLSEIEDDFGEENPKRIAASLRRIFSSDAGTPEN